MRDNWRNRSELLLILPFVGLLWPQWYARWSPELLGFPFFYWFQFLWVAITAGITALVFWIQRRRER